MVEGLGCKYGPAASGGPFNTTSSMPRRPLGVCVGDGVMFFTAVKARENGETMASTANGPNFSGRQDKVYASETGNPSHSATASCTCPGAYAMPMTWHVGRDGATSGNRTSVVGRPMFEARPWARLLHRQTNQVQRGAFALGNLGDGSIVGRSTNRAVVVVLHMGLWRHRGVHREALRYRPRWRGIYAGRQRTGRSLEEHGHRVSHTLP